MYSIKNSMKISVLLILGLTLGNCSSPTSPQLIEKISDDEYKVLSSIVDSIYMRDPLDMAIIKDSTNCGIFAYDRDSLMTLIFNDLLNIVPSLKNETILDFKEKNENSYYIDKPSKINSRFILYSEAWKDSIWDWQEFYQKYPNAIGLVMVGRVGFNSDHKQALAYVGLSEGPKAGIGKYYVLSVENYRWKIIGSILIWIS